MTTPRSEARGVEGQRSHLYCWHLWESGFKAGLAGPKCFCLIMGLYSGLEVGGK